MYVKYYQLHPCHFISSPGLIWDARLTVTGVTLAFSDIDMYLFVETNMREEISYVAQRYCEANNKHMDSYDDSKPSK